jgi:hypothetical protein
MRLSRAKMMMIMSGAVASSVRAEVKTETIEYKQGDAVLEGYLAYDDALQGKRPGIAVPAR